MANEVQVTNTPLEVNAPLGINIPVEVKNDPRHAVPVDLKKDPSDPVPVTIRRFSAPSVLQVGHDYNLLGDLFVGPPLQNPMTVLSIDFFPWVEVQHQNDPASAVWINMDLVTGLKPL